MIDKNKVREIGADVEQALKAVAAKHGMKLSFKGGTFDPSGMYRPRVEFSTSDRAEAEFKKYANMFGLQPEWFGKTFTNASYAYTVSGLKTGAGRRPVIAKRSDGKDFVFTTDFISASFGGVKAATLTEVKLEDVLKGRS